MKKLFEYAVVMQEKKDKQTGEIIDPAAVLVQPTTILADDEGQVNMVAARAIPEANVGDLERITLAVRPF